MPSPKKNRKGLFGTLLRLARCERGNSQVFTGALLTMGGVAMVSQALPYLMDSADITGDAIKRQAGVLARGSDTGAVNNLPGGGQGFDMGGIGSALERAAGSVFELGGAGKPGSWPSGPSNGNPSNADPSGTDDRERR